jgi:hypothetical protein
MKTIGFGGTFYTLWDVESDLINIAPGASYNKVTATYYKNLSKNLEEAKLKAGTDNFDECLQGKKRSFSYNTPIVIEPKLITECGRLWRIICVNNKEYMVPGVREEAFEQAKKLGHLTECIDPEKGVYWQWNGPLRYDEDIWNCSTMDVWFKGVV